MSETHTFTGLFPGDFFIHRFDLAGQIFFAYGIIRDIDLNGNYRADYQSQQPPLKPLSVQNEEHRVVGRISKRAYELARLRNWPNNEEEVAMIIEYSTGRPVTLSIFERIRLFLVR